MTNNILGIVGNIIFVLICSKLKTNKDEYILFLNWTRNHNLSNYKNTTGFSSMEWNEIFKGNTLTEDGFMNNCPEIMIQKPWGNLNA